MGGKTTIPFSSTQAKTKHLLKNTAQSKVTKVKARFQGFSSRIILAFGFHPHYQKGQRSINKSNIYCRVTFTGLSMLSSKNTCQWQDMIYVAKPKLRMISYI